MCDVEGVIAVPLGTDVEQDHLDLPDGAAAEPTTAAVATNKYRSDTGDMVSISTSIRNKQTRTITRTLPGNSQRTHCTYICQHSKSFQLSKHQQQKLL